MKIRILESVACSVNGAHGPGDVVDWKTKKEAEQLIKAGVAEAVKATKKKATKETASAESKNETASLD